MPAPPGRSVPASPGTARAPGGRSRAPAAPLQTVTRVQREERSLLLESGRAPGEHRSLPEHAGTGPWSQPAAGRRPAGLRSISITPGCTNSPAYPQEAIYGFERNVAPCLPVPFSRSPACCSSPAEQLGKTRAKAQKLSRSLSGVLSLSWFWQQRFHQSVRKREISAF